MAKTKRRERVLVTGGSGFIGSHIVDRLLADGYEVFVMDIASLNRNSDECQNSSVVPNFRKIWSTYGKRLHYTERSIAVKSFVDVVIFDWAKPDYIIHCAGKARIQPSFENTEAYIETNVVGTWNLLNAASKFGIKKFVYSSSSSIYGGGAEVPCLSEDLPSDPLNPYALTKLQAEQWVSEYARNFNVPACSLRYFNVYGPRQIEGGQYATVIGIFLRQFKNKEPLSIVLSEHKGNQRRDFTWIGDVVRANILAVESRKVFSGEVINVGCGKNYSIWEVASMVCGVPDIQKREDLWVRAPDRKNEAKQTLAENRKAKKQLGWNPECTLKSGIEILKKKY